VKGHARINWFELIDDDLDRMWGDRDLSVGEVQDSYGVTKEEA
jgi:uncharacterized protein YjbJ (UPF0337 family)